MAVTTLFLDVGGVLLTNGWDRAGRRRVAERFEFDYDEFAERHDYLAHAFETDRIGIHEYLRHAVFYRPRDFTEEAFVAAMKAESAALPESLELLGELATSGVFLATLNNESRMLNEHRISTFGLQRYFKAFLSSCYLRCMKPEPQIYKTALAVTRARPEETLFVDDRPLNLECAADEGLPGIHFESAPALRNELEARGVLR